MSGPRTYTLLGTDGKPYRSASKGHWGGHRGTRIYGRLDCPAALRAVGRGGYTRYRVFFADEATAIAAGYRPCALCCPDRYQEWKTPGKNSSRPPGQQPSLRQAPPARKDLTRHRGPRARLTHEQQAGRRTGRAPTRDPAERRTPNDPERKPVRRSGLLGR
jgi:hypothetical protein